MEKVTESYVWRIEWATSQCQKSLVKQNLRLLWAARGKLRKTSGWLDEQEVKIRIKLFLYCQRRRFEGLSHLTSFFRSQLFRKLSLIWLILLFNVIVIYWYYNAFKQIWVVSAVSKHFLGEAVCWIFSSQGPVFLSPQTSDGFHFS